MLKKEMGKIKMTWREWRRIIVWCGGQRCMFLEELKASKNEGQKLTRR